MLIKALMLILAPTIMYSTFIAQFPFKFSTALYEITKYRNIKINKQIMKTNLLQLKYF